MGLIGDPTALVIGNWKLNPNSLSDAHKLIDGISKKYKLGKKKGTLQVLYDFLHFSNQVNTQPVIFRTGFNF